MLRQRRNIQKISPSRLLWLLQQGQAELSDHQQAAKDKQHQTESTQD